MGFAEYILLVGLLVICYWILRPVQRRLERALMSWFDRRRPPRPTRVIDMDSPPFDIFRKRPPPKDEN